MNLAGADVRVSRLSRKRIGGFWRSTQQERSDLFDRFAEG